MTPGPDGTDVVFVRDNGVGFDMRYADKLSGVFPAPAPGGGGHRRLAWARK